ncbi:hypothetical protein SALBM311S_10610 [Streptomyces alboniger]
MLLTNPPFGRRLENVDPPPYWAYGTARRTEFDWLQYAVSRLAPEGRAAVLLPAGASFNAGAAETVRAGLVEAGAVECAIALPAGLFALTAVKTQIWFLRAPGPKGTAHPRGAVRGRWNTWDTSSPGPSGPSQTTTSPSWWGSTCRGTRPGRPAAPFAGTPGLSRAVPVPDIAEHGHSLIPQQVRVRPAGTASVADAGGPAETRGTGWRNWPRRFREPAHAGGGGRRRTAARWLRRYGL